ncbi:helix-turn-helix transcriptional regulator [Zooshikella ganghwensis]|uniref:AraC family transcriptional regulator n=1 Tax=Zooshikella ganghwensis TaxID=202772 RepID=A0A4P9VWZ1_9GAMM|nr:helix-turn-helix transcriptional regulator [Zooshikella ganghwensis]RDH46420.1 AraC family transcriptional regulator [Zooshikella ganghwensis]
MVANSTSVNIGIFRVYCGEGCVITLGRTLVTEWHSHLSYQISLGLHGNPLALDVNNERCLANGFIIGSAIPHRLEVYGDCCLTILVDSDHLHSHHLQHLLQSREVLKLSSQQVKNMLLQIFDAFENKQYLDIKTLMASLNKPCGCHYGLDKRIAKAVEIIDCLPEKIISSQSIAEKVCLSESRFRHLFKENIGVNFRQYLLWRRLNDALKYALLTNSLTIAATKAGFSDSAHLSRTCKEMYGLKPSFIMRQGYLSSSLATLVSGVEQELVNTQLLLGRQYCTLCTLV